MNRSLVYETLMYASKETNIGPCVEIAEHVDKISEQPEVVLHLTKTTDAQNEVVLSYHSLRGLYFLAVAFVRSIFAIV